MIVDKRGELKMRAKLVENPPKASGRKDFLVFFFKFCFTRPVWNKIWFT